MERGALHSAAVKFSLDLHPSATGDVMEGVRDQLNASLLRLVLVTVSAQMNEHVPPAVHPVAANYDLCMLDCYCRPSVYLDGVLVSYTNPCILSKQVTPSIKSCLAA